MTREPKTAVVGARIESYELTKLKALADDCGISISSYLRDLIRLEMKRAKRPLNLTYSTPPENERSRN